MAVLAFVIGVNFGFLAMGLLVAGRDEDDE